ncbi:hypothetical protein CRG98_035977 [Punica granatum]|uniref:Uncharacterized protein n=1 Tax=Punica granatum TaxID=22663 RepID=A0A2I0IHZ0_PUNGR|nr:hypothetical protein CRG98_035977 [Punica granatum]
MARLAMVVGRNGVKEAREAYPILAHRLPAREFPTEARDTIPRPAIRGRIGRHGVTNNGRRARLLRKTEESHWKNERTKNPEMAELALWHYSSPSHRSIERCPIWGFKNPPQCQSDQRDVRAHFRGILLKPGHPDPPRTPFLTELPGFASLTSKRPLKAGLQAPRDHRGRGTSFRQPSGTRLGLPKYVSVVANASR